MKKLYKLAGLFAVVGVVVLAYGLFLANGDSKLGRISSSYKECKFESSTVEDIEINELSENIIVEKGNSDKLVIKYYTPEKTNDVSLSESNGLVKYTRERKSDKVMIGIDYTDTTTVVTLPKDFHGEVKTTSTSGGTKISGAECSDLSAKTSSGSIKLENISADNSVNVKATSGSVKVSNVAASKSSFETSSGSIKLENLVSTEKIIAKATSGSIHITDIVSDAIGIKASSGSVGGTIKGRESDYSVLANTSSGSCNLDNSREGTKTLDVETTSGSVKISFAE